MSEKNEIAKVIKFIQNGFIVNEKGKIKSQKNNRYYTPSEVLGLYRKSVEAFGDSTDMTVEDFTKVIESLKPKDNIPCINLHDYLLNDIFKNQNFLIDPTFSEIKFRANGCQYYSNSNFDELLTHYRSIAETDEVLSQYKIGTIESMLKKIAMEANSNKMNSISKSIAYDPNCEKYIDPFLKCYDEFLEIEEDYDIFKTITMHFMWQVKRKITNKPVVWHIWPNFFGPTGIGKSFFLKRFCSPFENYYIETKISSFFDDTKEIGKFTNKFIVNFEELSVNREKIVAGEAALSKDEISTLKAMITGEKRDTRIYGTQRQSTNVLTASYISSANEHLYDVFFDETSMRRYFDFTCKRSKPATEEEQKKLNKFLDHNELLWKAVDENRDKGYWDPSSEIGKKIAKIQSEYYPTKSNIIYFNRFYKFTYDANVKPTEIYTTYSAWCKNSGCKPKSLVNFNSEIKRRWPKLIGKDDLPHFKAELRDDNTIKMDDNGKIKVSSVDNIT